ncbi:hypothetical protein [Victivallis sp. Marseille-Q1083]|uniref:hypothetical protein n=1 Tax=Victivallis sp. Marseille-Q1083 TaxID=2717288 RepID=UPI00158E64F5|nr:hypothetical protein [Victivallis sp. Marseille-Q1083]
MFKKLWHPEMIQQHILQRYGQEPLNSYYYATNYPDVYAAAERLFGSWGETIEACGLDYDEIRKYKTWTSQGVLEEIRAMDERGEPLHSKYIQTINKSLYMAALKRFGNWGKAVQSAGISYKQIRLRRSMTAEETKRKIIELFKRNEDLSYTNMRKNHQYLLAAGMKKLGNGSWAAARLACGILTNYRLDRNKRKEQKS